MEENENRKDNRSCILHGSPHCALLNEESCATCYIGKLPLEKQAEAAEDIYYIAEALPEEGVDGIMTSGVCALCRTGRGEEAEEAGEATRFAQIDMGHEHPEKPAKPGEKTDSKYDRGASMVIPVQLPVCDKCRTRLNMLYYLPIALGVLVALAGLVLMAIEPIRVPLARYGKAVPFLVFLIFVFLGVIVESIAKKTLRVRIERTMNTRAKRIPALAPLLKKGWFVIGSREGMLPFTFTAERLPSGILTGEGQQEQIAEILSLGKEGIGILKQRMGENAQHGKKKKRKK